MKADLTRDTFSSFKHFRRVLMQQGRVQLDADWNEQAAILLHYLQSLAADVIGQAGGTTGAFAISKLPVSPAVTNDFRIGLGDYYVDGILSEADSSPVDVGFEAGSVSGTSATATATVEALTLDGVEFQTDQFVELFDDVPFPPGAFPPLVVRITTVDQANRRLTLTGGFNTPIPGSNPPVNWGDAIAKASASNPALRRVITYLTQPDYPAPDALKLQNTYLVYLDVWERHITYIEDDSIREVALGGPDTATRSKLVWQVKVSAGSVSDESKKTPCDKFTPQDSTFLLLVLGENRGRLKAMAKQKSTSTDPCIIPPDANYRGAENQLYRVEIHRPGPVWNGQDGTKSSAATFKWSRENGSVIFPVVSIATGGGITTVVLENLGRDDRFGLDEGDWVELLDDVYVLQNRTADLLQVQKIDPGALTVTLKGSADSSIGKIPDTHPLLRRWDQKEGDPAEGGLTLGSDNAALVEESSNSWLVLEEGVQIQFQPPLPGRPDNQYRTGDYWLIPARTATGDVEWPRETIKDSSGANLAVPIAKPPDGIQHHYAPLAVIDVASTGISVRTPGCRKEIKPVSQ